MSVGSLFLPRCNGLSRVKIWRLSARSLCIRSFLHQEKWLHNGCTASHFACFVPHLVSVLILQDFHPRRGSNLSAQVPPPWRRFQLFQFVSCWFFHSHGRRRHLRNSGLTLIQHQTQPASTTHSHDTTQNTASLPICPLLATTAYIASTGGPLDQEESASSFSLRHPLTIVLLDTPTHPSVAT